MGKRLTKQEFIDKANIVHNFKYDYNDLVYINNKTPVKIVCPIHSVFEQRPDNHLHGYGCKLCGHVSTTTSQLITVQEFINRAISVHGNVKYSYNIDKLCFNGMNSKVNIFCNTHNKYFSQRASDHINGSGCPSCSHSTSKLQDVIVRTIRDNFASTEIIERFKPIWLSNQEIDIYIPSINIGIEVNGILFHSTEVVTSSDKLRTLFNSVKKDKFYHLNKYLLCKQNNIDLIHVFENESIESIIQLIFKVIDQRLNNISNYILFYNTRNTYVHSKNTTYYYYGVTKILLKDF